MKTLFRLFMLVATVVFGLMVVVKIVRRCSWQEAVGILEELCKELRDACLVFGGGLDFDWLALHLAHGPVVLFDVAAYHLRPRFVFRPHRRALRADDAPTRRPGSLESLGGP